MKWEDRIDSFRQRLSVIEARDESMCIAKQGNNWQVLDVIEVPSIPGRVGA